jgi:hypothetical protein
VLAAIRDVSHLHPAISTGTRSLVIVKLLPRYFENKVAWGGALEWESLMPLEEPNAGFVPLVGAGTDDIAAAEFAVAEESLLRMHKKYRKPEPVVVVPAAEAGGGDSRKRHIDHSEYGGGGGGDSDEGRSPAKAARTAAADDE